MTRSVIALTLALTTFPERWTLRLDGTGENPWRIGVAAHA